MVPQPSVARYWAIVVVKPPELEKMAIEPLMQRLVRMVAAERAADAHAVPGIGHAKTIGAEDIDAVGLAHGTDLARIVHRDLFRDDHDLLSDRD